MRRPVCDVTKNEFVRLVLVDQSARRKSIDDIWCDRRTGPGLNQQPTDISALPYLGEHLAC